jgi:hypothetical protein
MSLPFSYAKSNSRGIIRNHITIMKSVEFVFCFIKKLRWKWKKKCPVNRTVGNCHSLFHFLSKPVMSPITSGSSNGQNFPFSNCQIFLFQTVKFSFFKLSSFPFPNCQIFLFQTVKFSFFKLSKFPFPNCQNFLSKLSNFFFFSNCKNFLFQTVKLFKFSFLNCIKSSLVYRKISDFGFLCRDSKSLANTDPNSNHFWSKIISIKFQAPVHRAPKKN